MTLDLKCHSALLGVQSYMLIITAELTVAFRAGEAVTRAEFKHVSVQRRREEEGETMSRRLRHAVG